MLIVNGCFNFALVQSWIQKCEVGNIFKLDKVIFAMHRDGSHWTCAVSFMKTKHIYYYDSSLGSIGKNFTDDIMECLSEEWEYQYYQLMPRRFPSKDWTINDVEVPMQGNHYDCGIFTCMFGYLFGLY